MRTLEGKRVVEKIINLTGKAFCVYEESTGVILTLIPSTEILPDTPRYGINKLPNTYYVVEREKIYKIKKYRTLTDIAFVKNTSTGRDGIEVSTLVLANRPDIRIGIRRVYYHPEPINSNLPNAKSPNGETQKEDIQRFESRHYAEVL